MTSAIRTARLRARLTQEEVGAALGRSGQWILLVENGRIHVVREVETHVLKTIAKLAAFNETTRADKERLFEDLQLPPYVSSASR